MPNDPSITTVPLTVYFGEEARLDWVDLKPEEFYDRLENGPVLPRTSQPSAGAFLDVYKALREKLPACLLGAPEWEVQRHGGER